MGTAASPLPGSAALVWFKRDLRLRDHAPLAEAARFQHAAGLVVLEPQWLHSPECHPRHLAWLLACVAELKRDLAARGLPLVVRSGDMPQVLAELRRDYPFTHLLSHEETGPGWSYKRDLAVADWCRHHGVDWRELPQTGVVRRLRSRTGWAGRWARRMDAPEAPTTTLARGWPGVAGSQGLSAWVDHDLPSLADVIAQAADQPSAGVGAHAGLQAGMHAGLQTGTPVGEQPGERAAWATLQSFLAGRGRGYRRALSSPLSAASGCSRLSAHLAFGSLSMRCVHQATEARIAALRASGSADDPRLAYDLRGFASRLRWHCHFMQKLEDEPALEYRNLARSADGLRPGDGIHPQPENAQRLQAWCEGRTGFPMVDACMRQLRATGWLNFRMRAMLVSFAAYHLWLHWREPGLFLARQFLDFEPGIHWSQMQMQSGTTGINTLRIYSPAKQALDHDPQGLYIRQWLPEFGTPAYPRPIVDERAAVATAKAALYGLRQTREAQAEADAIQHKHGSRKSGLPPTTPTPQPGAAPARRRQAATPAPGADGQGQLF